MHGVRGCFLARRGLIVGGPYSCSSARRRCGWRVAPVELRLRQLLWREAGENSAADSVVRCDLWRPGRMVFDQCVPGYTRPTWRFFRSSSSLRRVARQPSLRNSADQCRPRSHGGLIVVARRRQVAGSCHPRSTRYFNRIPRLDSNPGRVLRN